MPSLSFICCALFYSSVDVYILTGQRDVDVDVDMDAMRCDAPRKESIGLEQAKESGIENEKKGRDEVGEEGRRKKVYRGGRGWVDWELRLKSFWLATRFCNLALVIRRLVLLKGFGKLLGKILCFHLHHPSLQTSASVI